MLRDHLIQIDFTVLILLHPKVDDPGGITVLSQEISQSQKTDGGEINERKPAERLVVVVKFGNMEEQKIRQESLLSQHLWLGLRDYVVMTTGLLSLSLQTPGWAHCVERVAIHPVLFWRGIRRRVRQER
jgi:hypothetical protein